MIACTRSRLALVDFHPRQLVAGEPRDHPEQVRQGPHFADCAQLVEEVVEAELVAPQLALELARLALVELLLGLLDEAHDVAHAEDPLGHAVGVEALELVELLARGGEHDRLARHRLDRQRGAAARVTVELAHDDAVELDRLGEALGDVDRVLPGHRVDDEQHVVRFDGVADADELGHQLLVDVQATAGVDDQHVLAVLAGSLQRPGGDLDGLESVPCS